MKHIPNCISYTRIILSFTLIFFAPDTLLFQFLYILCGISDILDGYIARRFHLASAYGATIDSLGDVIFFIISFVKIIPQLGLPNCISIWIQIIFCFRLVAIIILWHKHNTFLLQHSYSNKFTGFMLFCTPILLNYFNSILWEIIVCMIATYSSIEEIFLQLREEKI